MCLLVETCAEDWIEDKETLIDSFYAVEGFTNPTKHKEVVAAILESNYDMWVLKWLSENTQADQKLHPSLRIIGNLAEGSEEVCVRLVKGGVLNVLEGTLHSRHSRAKQDAVWTLSNIASSSRNNYIRESILSNV